MYCCLCRWSIRGPQIFPSKTITDMCSGLAFNNQKLNEFSGATAMEQSDGVPPKARTVGMLLQIVHFVLEFSVSDRQAAIWIVAR
jgi:hypothetical protein